MLVSEIPPFSQEQLEDAARSFAAGALAGLIGERSIDIPEPPRGLCRDTFERVEYAQREAAKAHDQMVRDCWERCQGLAELARRLRHARAA